MSQQKNEIFTLDRREGDIWVAEKEDGTMCELTGVPAQACDGDRIMADANGFVLVPATAEERQQIKSRMDSIFSKRR